MCENHHGVLRNVQTIVITIKGMFMFLITAQHRVQTTNALNGIWKGRCSTNAVQSEWTLSGSGVCNKHWCVFVSHMDTSRNIEGWLVPCSISYIYLIPLFLESFDEGFKDQEHHQSSPKGFSHNKNQEHQSSPKGFSHNKHQEHHLPKGS